MSGTRSPRVPRWKLVISICRAEEEVGVGLASFGGNPESFTGEVLGLFDVPGDLGSQDEVECESPPQDLNPMSFGERLHHSKTAVNFIDITHRCRSDAPPRGRKTEQIRISYAFGSDECIGSAGEPRIRGEVARRAE